MRTTIRNSVYGSIGWNHNSLPINAGNLKAIARGHSSITQVNGRGPVHNYEHRSTARPRSYNFLRTVRYSNLSSRQSLGGRRPHRQAALARTRHYSSSSAKADIVALASSLIVVRVLSSVTRPTYLSGESE